MRPLQKRIILSCFSLLGKFFLFVKVQNHFYFYFRCGHCQRLTPTWEQLAEMLNEDDSEIRIAKVDCTTDSSVCSAYDVTGYPTLKFFRAGDKEGVKFRGTRDLPSLTTFINEQMRLVKINLLTWDFLKIKVIVGR